MNIPQSLFRPILENRRVDASPIVSSLKRNLRKACENHLDSASPEYIDYNERKSDFWLTRPGGRLLPRSIETLATGGILLDGKYATEACNILQTIVKHRIVENCGGTNYGRTYSTWRDNCLDAGASSMVLAIGLDLLRHELTDTERAEIGAYCLPFIDFTLENPPDPGETRPDWNMAAIGLIGLGLLGLVLRNYGVLDESRFNSALALSRKRCRLFLEKGHDGDGAFYEGPAYGSATLHYLAPFALALAVCGDRELATHAGWERIAEGLVYELIPATGRPNPLNDCNDGFHVEWLALLASQQGSGLAQWLWQSIDKPPSDGEYWHLPADGWSDSITRYLLYLDPSVEPAPPDRSGMPGVRHFRNRGLVDVRSGWRSDDFFLSFLCDVFPAGGHRQADRNQFALHALGETFACDSGYALERLPDTTEVLRLGALGEAHNLPLVMGEMQRRGPGGADGIVRADIQGAFPFIEAEAGGSYGCAQRFVRRLLCLPDARGTPAAVIIVDRLDFEMHDRPMLSWLLHTAAGNRLACGRDRVSIIGRRRENRCDVRIATPWPGRWREETFHDHPRLRYDWFWSPLFCIVALVPYQKDTPPPEIDAAGDASGCAIRIRTGNLADTVLTAGPGNTVAFNDIRTDAEFAHVRTVDESVDAGTFAAGSVLEVSGRFLVSEPVSIDYRKL
ncbi:MAG: heparinase II/III family protein [Gemmatimonadota bacterium]|nr:heparinase II/III family protein [Gemmatimonadota bacterium]